MMKRIIPAFLVLAPCLALAAPITIPWRAPGGGISGASRILGAGTTLDGKTMLDLLTQVDANTTLAAAAIPKSGNIDATGSLIAPILSPSLQGVFANLASIGSAPVLSIGGTQSSYLVPGQNSDPYISPHALWLGAQRAGASTGTPLDQYGTGSSIVLRGHPDGYMDQGCLYCAVMTNAPVFASRAGLTSDINLIENIGKDTSFDTVVHYDQSGDVEPVLTLENVTYDATHIYLPSGSPLTPQQISRIHPNQYVTTNSITGDVAQTEIRTTDSGIQNPTVGTSLNPKNYYVTTVASVAADGSSITVNGWGILNGNSTGHPWKTGDVPTATYDTVRSNFGHAVAMIGSPTQTGGTNTYLTFDPTQNPHSAIDYINAYEFDMHYNGDKSNEATMRGIVISMDCEGAAVPAAGVCYHPTYDSTGLIINGANLPNGIQNTVSGWANEYKGYNFYIPGSQAPAVGQGQSHTNFESFTPSQDGHQMVMRTSTQQYSTSTSPTWTDYRVNLGLVIDGTRWDSSGSTGSPMGYLSFDYSGANLGGVCLIGNSTTAADPDVPGLCVRGSGDVYMPWSVHLSGNGSIVGSSANGNQNIGATLQPDANGDWNVGTQVSGGANIRGVNLYYGTGANLTGTIHAGVVTAPWFEVGDGSSGAITFKHGSFMQATNAAGGITATLTPDDSGNWTFGTQVAGGANVGGINALTATTIKGTVSNTPYLEGVALVRAVATNQTLSDIENSSHQPSDRVFCGDCRNSGQGAGEGSGRWIFLDTKSQWRSEDGVIAAD